MAVMASPDHNKIIHPSMNYRQCGDFGPAAARARAGLLAVWRRRVLGPGRRRRTSTRSCVSRWTRGATTSTPRKPTTRGPAKRRWARRCGGFRETGCWWGRRSALEHGPRRAGRALRGQSAATGDRLHRPLHGPLADHAALDRPLPPRADAHAFGRGGLCHARRLRQSGKVRFIGVSNFGRRKARRGPGHRRDDRRQRTAL